MVVFCAPDEKAVKTGIAQTEKKKKKNEDQLCTAVQLCTVVSSQSVC